MLSTIKPRKRFVLCVCVLAAFISSLALVLRHLPQRYSFVPEHQQRQRTAGARICVLLWTQVRSGSTFTGSILTTGISTFYSEEPIRAHNATLPKGVNASTLLLKDILHCRFAHRPKYFKEHIWMHSQDLRIRALCELDKSFCSLPATFEAFCRASQVGVVRVVGVALHEAVPLLEDDSLDVRVIHLVRDARAAIASRRGFPPGYFYEAETNASLACARYRQDLAAVPTILQRYPDRYLLVRYEDLVLQPEREVRRLYKFAGLPFTASVAKVLFQRTSGLDDTWELQHPFTISRKSSEMMDRWQKQLDYRDMLAIQRECDDVLRAYGYRVFASSEEYAGLGALARGRGLRQV
ncbi:carbohydrate sulfotransferase 1-like [Penaeus indicus]|uniref:carbohydrate sulfotransferase 1-like n=1 Tax=Penaeus indicus TaxID=29960 RepID=UPI00300C98B2